MTAETAGTYYSVEILVFFQDGDKDWFPQSEHMTFQEALDAAAKLNTTNMIYIDEMHRDADGNASGVVVWKGYLVSGKLVIESYMQSTAAACMERKVNVCAAL